jgi:NMD protein affecting ribosome stability and mRNA decay
MDAKDIRKKMEDFISKVPIVENRKEKKPKFKIEKQPKHAQYFEGELQLRNVNKEILNYVLNKIHKAKENIPEVKEFSEKDVNFKITSKKLAHQLGLELKKKFGGEVKESETHFSKDHQTGKDIFRLNVYYKKHPFNIGEYVEFKSEPYKIRGFDKNKIKSVNIITNRRTQLPKDEIKLLKIQKCEVVQDKPKNYVLDENYQNIELVSDKVFKIHQKIKCVFINNKAYYLS